MDLQDYIFVQGLDSSGGQIAKVDVRPRHKIEKFFEELKPKAVCFNSLGVFKESLGKLAPSPLFKSWDGLYLNRNFLATSGDIAKVPIKIINLERRPDRRAAMTEKLTQQKFSPDNYEFVKATDGKDLVLTPEIEGLFKKNNFNNRRSVIGCALSHYYLWKKLLEDPNNEFYLILEDDIDFSKNFKEELTKLSAVMPALEFFFLAYLMEGSARVSNWKKYNGSSRVQRIEEFKKTPPGLHYFGGGFSTYSINKAGARKVLEYINSQGIYYAIDYMVSEIKCLKIYECQPQLTFTDSAGEGVIIDTDIQKDYEPIAAASAASPGTSLTPGAGAIKVKLLWNFSDPAGILKDFANMCEREGKFFKDLEMVTTDKADYYVIVNYPRPGDYFDPKKTIIIHGEPRGINDAIINRWGAYWANPDPSKFLFVGSSKYSLNLVQWYYKDSPEMLLKNNPIKSNVISSIVSSQYFNPGHKKRINFLKYLQSQDFDIDIYGYSNEIGFKNHKGNLTNKSLGLLPYKYYFMAENSKENNYVTEKMWEPLIAECFVFYWGAPNVSEYVDPRCYIHLDLEDFEKDMRTVKRAISENSWEKNLPYIREMKKKIITEYGFFPKIHKLIKDDLLNVESKPKAEPKVVSTETKIVDSQTWEFFPGVDSVGGDFTRVKPLGNDILLKIANTQPSCVAINTLGYMKNTINPFTEEDFCRGKIDQGIWVRAKTEAEVEAITEVETKAESEAIVEAESKAESESEAKAEAIAELEDYIFIQNHDQIAHDIKLFQSDSVKTLARLSDANPKCVGFNSLGYFKNQVLNLVKPQLLSGKHGIYLKKSCFKIDKASYNDIITCFWEPLTQSSIDRFVSRFPERNICFILQESFKDTSFDLNDKLKLVFVDHPVENIHWDHQTLKTLISYGKTINKALYVPQDTYFYDDYLIHSDVTRIEDIGAMLDMMNVKSIEDNQKTIVITGAARNIERDFPTTSKILLKLASMKYFKESHIVIFENGSTDKTKEMLMKFQMENPNLVTILNDESVTNIECREQRIGTARNILLNYTLATYGDKSETPLDLYLTMDLDEVSGYYYGIENALSRFSDSSVTGVFPIPNGYYYDIYALRDKYVTQDCWRINKNLDICNEYVVKNQVDYRFHSEEFVKVKSAFGGAGLYRWSSIKNRNYGWINEFNTIECEHVYFHRGLDGLYIDTKWLVAQPPPRSQVSLISAYKNRDIEFMDLEPMIKDHFVYLPKKDQIGHDIKHLDASIDNLLKIALEDPNAVAVNSLGFFKDSIVELTSPQNFLETGGIYIKKHYHNYLTNSNPAFICFYGQVRSPQMAYNNIKDLIKKLEHKHYNVKVIAHFWYNYDGKRYESCNTWVGSINSSENLNFFLDNFKPVSISIENSRRFNLTENISKFKHSTEVSRVMSQMKTRTNSRDLLLKYCIEKGFTQESIRDAPVFMIRTDFGNHVNPEIITEFEKDPRLVYINGRENTFEDNFIVMNGINFFNFFDNLHGHITRYYRESMTPKFHGWWSPESILQQRSEDLSLEIRYSKNIPFFA
jgi:GR25 family glycosyltransferase involved in LPS biosynthesis